MRVGTNPQRSAAAREEGGWHQIIVPLYVADGHTYFDGVLEVGEACLRGLRSTTQATSSITVVSDGCGHRVEDQLVRWRREGLIDRLVLQPNSGKVDALLSVARGASEELVTLCDADMLLLPGWLEASVEVFASFPQAGVVSPLPAPNLRWASTASTVCGAFFRGSIGWTTAVAPLDLSEFERSVGGTLFSELDRRTQLVVRSGPVKACVGAPHCVFTVRGAVLDSFPRESCGIRLGGEDRWLDMPPDRAGWWRLSTPRAYARHLGNRLEVHDLRVSDRGQDPAPPSPYEMESAPRARPALGRVPWVARRILARVIRRALETRCPRTTDENASCG